MDNQVYIGGDEFVFNVNENGQHIGGGFSIPSIMTKMGMSPIMTVNVNDTSQMSGGGNQVSDLFKNTAVPSWATMYRMHGGEYTEYDKNDKGQIKKKKRNVKKSKGNDNDSVSDSVSNSNSVSDSDSDSNSVSDSDSDSNSDSDSVVSDGLHDKLLELAKEQDNKIRKIKRKNTKKNKDREKKERNTTKKQSKEK